MTGESQRFLQKLYRKLFELVIEEGKTVKDAALMNGNKPQNGSALDQEVS
jgi:hypothetical protein